MVDIARAAALVLSAIFAWAALAKLLRLPQTRASFRALGVPLPQVAAPLVPGVELALAAVVLVRPAVAWGAVVLLVVFTAFLASAIRRGVDVPCSCFGSSRTQAVSSVEVVRNGMLVALAVVASGAPAGWSWPGLPALVIVTTVAALGRVVLAALDLRRDGNPLWPPLPRSEP